MINKTARIAKSMQFRALPAELGQLSAKVTKHIGTFDPYAVIGGIFAAISKHEQMSEELSRYVGSYFHANISSAHLPDLLMFLKVSQKHDPVLAKIHASDTARLVEKTVNAADGQLCIEVLEAIGSNERLMSKIQETHIRRMVHHIMTRGDAPDMDTLSKLENALMGREDLVLAMQEQYGQYEDESRSIAQIAAPLFATAPSMG